jgi:hypothetical protein
LEKQGFNFYLVSAPKQALEKVMVMDAFWLERLEAGSLAWGQIKHIKERASLASLLCANIHENILQVVDLFIEIFRLETSVTIQSQ